VFEGYQKQIAQHEGRRHRQAAGENEAARSVVSPSGSWKVTVGQEEIVAVMARRGAGELVVVVRIAVGVGFSSFSSGSTSTYSSRRPSQVRRR
jgi:hypothetical protein